MVRFTSVVRRGLRQFLARRLEWHVERIIQNGTAPHLGRSHRLTKAEVEELRSALEWIKENAEPERAEQAAEPEASPPAAQETTGAGHP